MGKRSEICVRKVLCTAAFVLALCVGFGFAMQHGMKAVEAKQAVSLTKAQVRLVKGEKIRLQLRGAKGKAVWKSKDKTIASVDKNGTVKAIKSGKTKISVKYGKKAYSCTIWVEAPKINKKSMELKAGTKAQLKISGTKQKVSWSSGQKSIASVNSKGIVSAKKAGKATITAKVGTKKFQCKVTVKAQAKEDQNPTEGSGNQDPAEEPEGGNQMCDVAVQIKEGTVVSQSQSFVTVSIVNNGSKTVAIADGYALYQKQEGKWLAVPMDFASSCAVQKLKPGKSLERICRLEDGDIKCQPGEYRIVIGTLHVDFQIQEEKEAEEKPAGDLKVWVKEGNRIPLSQKYITLVIENHSDAMKWMAYGYSIYRKQGDEWALVPMDVAFPDVMVEINPGERMEEKCSLEAASEKLQPGQYRVTKGKDIEVYFEILEDTDPVGSLEMRIKGDSAIPIGQPSVTFQIINHGIFTESLSRDYSLYIKRDDEWASVPLDYYFTCDMVDVEPGRAWEIECPLKSGEGDYYPPGQYRIEKGNLSVEFEIMAEAIPTDG